MLLLHTLRRCAPPCASIAATICVVCLFAAQASAQQSSLHSSESTHDGAFLDAVEHQQALLTQVIQASVARQLSHSREMFSADPAAAVAELKQALSQVEAAPELPAEVRAQLREQIVTAIKQGQRREVRMNEEQLQAAAREAQGKQRQRIINEAQRNEERVKQINARFNALLDEWRFRAAEQAAMEARDLQPRLPEMVAAVHTGRMQGYIHENLQVREARHRGIVDALFQVERAHVPVGGEPPIVYPNAQVWEELTLRRRKYAAMSLERQGSAEEKIFEALRQPTSLEFIETPLRDVVDYLKDLHGIEIQINYRALEEIGVSADTPLTRNLKGISLRSALRLMLRELDLTYSVQDEVLLITTPEEVESALTAKVYPVADLVLPINSGPGANPFQLGGGLGNQGAFGGGMNQGGQGGLNNQMPGGNFGNLFGNQPGAGPIF